MKKFLLLIGSMLLLVGCSKSISKDDWSQIVPGMSKAAVEDVIGKPKEEISDESQIKDDADAFISDSKELSSIKSDNALDAKISAMEGVKSALETDLDVLEYIYSVDKNDRQVIFVDDEAYFVNYEISE